MSAYFGCDFDFVSSFLAKVFNIISIYCRSRNTLLNGDSQNYDWTRGYTCHQLNSGCIQIQLGQPYMIDSMR